MFIFARSSLFMSGNRLGEAVPTVFAGILQVLQLGNAQPCFLESSQDRVRCVLKLTSEFPRQRSDIVTKA
jgi:hypothetical protein